MQTKLLESLSKTYGVSEIIIEQHILSLIVRLYDLISTNGLENQLNNQVVDVLYKDALELIEEERIIMNKIISLNNKNVKRIVINSTKKFIQKKSQNIN